MSAQSKAAARAGRAAPVSSSYPLQAPTGGLNTRDALANMPETDCVLIDNLYCQPTWVEIRGGSLTLATFTGQPLTLMAYAALSGANNQMFASVANGAVNSIYRVDNAGGGAVGAAVVGGAGNTIQQVTNPNFDYAQYGTGSAEVLWLVNGADCPLLYDGTTWYSITTVSVPYALTGGPTPLTSLASVVVYKQRIWFIQKNTMNVWYLPQAQFAGALTQLNVGPNFKLGGYLVAAITVSIDNTGGTNDYIAFLSNQGEVIMFQGYDPGNVATWQMSAHFRIGAPVGSGRDCWQKMGMDALIMCQDGFLLLSEAMLTDRDQTRNAVSDKVRLSVNQNIGLYGALNGWQVLLFPAGNKLIFNVPTSANAATSFQYVMNTLTGAWQTWGQYSSPLNASCWENFNNLLYYGKNGSIQQGDYGLSDNGTAITWSVKQAFSYCGEKSNIKRFTQAQPFLQTNGVVNVSLTLSIDFDNSMPTQAIPLSVGQGTPWGSQWGSLWGDAQQIIKNWIGVQGAGYAGALFMQGSTKNLTMKWQMTNIMFETGGTFYGK